MEVRTGKCYCNTHNPLRPFRTMALLNCTKSLTYKYFVEFIEGLWYDWRKNRGNAIVGTIVKRRT